LVAVAVNLRNDLSDAERVLLLRRWERVSFRIYGLLRKDARTRVGDYVRLAWRVINAQPTVRAIDAELQEIGSAFPIDDAIESVRAVDCYDGWENELRYFMYRYEEHLSRVRKMNFQNEQWEKIWLVSPSESIEHIWPQSGAPSKHVNRLGNMIVLPPRLNSALKDTDPAKKADAYRKTGLLIAGEVADAIERGGWKGQQVEARETALLDWAREEWGD
jgi:hypothetical protein